MRKYRLVLILKRSLDKKVSEKLVSDIKSWVGEVKNASDKIMGEKKFAYKINGEQSGVYHIWEFEAETIPSDFEIKIKNHDDVLRHLLVRLD